MPEMFDPWIVIIHNIIEFEYVSINILTNLGF